MVINSSLVFRWCYFFIVIISISKTLLKWRPKPPSAFFSFSLSPCETRNKISNCFWNVNFQAFRSKVDCSYPSQLKPLKPQLGLNEALYRKWWCKSLLQSLWQKFKTINTLSGHKQNVQTEMWNGKCDDVFALRIQNI